MLQQTNYINKAYLISTYKVADTVTTVEPGQYFQLNEDKEWEYADGTKKAYPANNTRLPASGLALQNEVLQGRDDVSQTGIISVFAGNFVLGTTMYDIDAIFVPGEPVVVSSGGVLIPFDESTHKVHLIEGYVLEAPVPGEESVLVYQS